MTAPVLLWLRQDLRLSDQPALLAAAADGPVIPIYVLDDETPGKWRIGAAKRWWLNHSLAALDAGLKARGSRLILRRGRAVPILRDLLRDTGATRVHALRHYEPWWREAEQALGDALCLHDGNHLASIEDVTTGSGTPFKVFSPFHRALARHLPPAAPRPAPDALPAPDRWPASDALNDWQLLPTAPDWATGFSDWTPGEDGAHARLAAFPDAIAAYGSDRDLPAQEGTSRLSPHLHHGEVSPAQVWHALADGEGAQAFRRELAWRDFTRGVLLALPDYADQNARRGFDALPWRDSPDDLRAWHYGRTGYPLVDAGMRQLWATGWMHNRVRMVTASFLVKHLLIDWRRGADWFWDCLLDADLGNNAVNWQWIAGSGTDSNTFGRIMAPLVQSRKFDAAAYIRTWVPELSHLSDDAIHDPDEAGCRPVAYPAKIIGHREARERALAAVRTSR